EHALLNKLLGDGGLTWADTEAVQGWGADVEFLGQAGQAGKYRERSQFVPWSD
ncbi:unnamed protein product, partial [Effrenium voratum]